MFSFLMGNKYNFATSGYVDFAYISRISDQSIIDIPYRIASIEFNHQKDHISLLHLSTNRN